MRAVNLVPPEQRIGAKGSLGAAHAVLAGLGLLLVLVSAWAFAGRAVADREGELARITAEADQTEARAAALEPYRQFADLRRRRVETVTGLVENRFDWAAALHEVSRVVPNDVWLTSLLGTVAPGVSVEGGSAGATGSLRSSLAVPAIEMSGCTRDQARVARFLTRLRTIEGVTRVSLAESRKGSGGATASAGSGDGGDCSAGSERPKFEAVVFFERSPTRPSGEVEVR